MGIRWALLTLCCIGVGSLHADLKHVLAEPNLEKRSGLALANAQAAYQTARTAYEKGETEQVTAAARELEESVDLAYKSLTEQHDAAT